VIAEEASSMLAQASIFIYIVVLKQSKKSEERYLLDLELGSSDESSKSLLPTASFFS
jgi:hypothetical protein